MPKAIAIRIPDDQDARKGQPVYYPYVLLIPAGALY